MVRARNQYGFGFHCEPIREQTLADSPSGEPTEVKVFADSVSRLIVQWKPPLLQDWNGQLTGSPMFFDYLASGFVFIIKSTFNKQEKLNRN